MRLAALCLCPFLLAFSLTDGAEEKAEFIEGLKRDIVKVDHSIEVTKDVIRKSKNAPFEPDVIFQLAELFIEKSRLVYYLDVELRGQEAASSAEAKLLKNEAINIYNDILKGFPEYKHADRVLFFMAHEFNELGMHDDMLKTYKRLVEDYSKSELLLEALYLIGEFYFNRDLLPDAESYYKKVLEYRESPVHDLARYKLGWIEINKAKRDNDKSCWKKALKLFETVVQSGNVREEKAEAGTNKPVNVKTQALDGICYCYTEVYKPKIALDYFRKLASSKTMFLYSLEKLANRYFIKEQYDNAAMMYRQIIELSNDVERNLDYAQRIYDASTFSKKKEKVDQDVRALVKAGSKYAFSWRIPDQEKMKLAKEFEVYARDIVTKLHLLAQQRNEKRAYRIAARAYKNYLSFFDYSEKIREIRFNYAESLFHSDQFLEAARAYETIARETKNDKERKDTLYSSIKCFQGALVGIKNLGRFETIEVRQGLKQLGSLYIAAYPQDKQVPTIKFNVARMFYDQGQYKEAIESFLEYIKQYPTHSEVAIAGHLVLDCYKQLEDYEGLAKQGEAFAADPAIRDQAFKAQAAAIAKASRSRDLDKKTLEIAKEGGDTVDALLKLAGTVEGGQAEEVLYRSFVMAKEKRNIEMAYKVGAQLAAQYKQSKYLEDIYASLGNFSAQMADFERAAVIYEDYFNHFPDKAEARGALQAAAKFYMYLGNYMAAIEANKKLLNRARGPERGAILADIAEAYAKMDDWAMVQQAAQQAASESPTAKALLLLGRAQEKASKSGAAKSAYARAASSGGRGDSAAAEAQFRLGNQLVEEFQRVSFGSGQPDVAVVQTKVQMIQNLEQVFAGVVQTGDASWAVAALWRLFEVYEEFAQFLRGAPVGSDASQQSQVEAAVKAQQTQARVYLATCKKTVLSKTVFGPYARACMTGSFSGSTDVAERSRSSQIDAEQIKPLQAKLLQSPNDLKTLADLARSGIVATDYHFARLVLSKALEIAESDATALNLLGVAEQYLGDEQAAYGYYRRAMEADGSNLASRLNLAGLFMVYGDETRARAVLKNVQGQARSADLSQPDIHTAAREALSSLRIR